MPRVSIILPCYNGAKWIGQAIESVLAQTYKDFELIVIDDGSTDNSKEVISSYLYDERVRYIYQENRGFSATLNRGIKESKGEFIGFIGQDDLYVPNKLQVQVRYLDEHSDVDLVHSNYCFINPTGQIIRIRHIKIPKFPSREKLIEHLFIYNFIGFETVLLRKKCLDKVGLFDERMIGFSDHDMWLRIAGEFNIAYIDSILVKKREHPQQLSKIAIERCLYDELLMAVKAIKRYPFLKKAIKKKLASIYYSLGLAMLEKEIYESAKQKFFKAIQYEPWKFKAIVAYIAPRIYKLARNNYCQLTPMLHRALMRVEG